MFSWFSFSFLCVLFILFRLKSKGKKRALQIFLLFLLLLAFGDIAWNTKASRRNVVFFLDVSDSVRLVHQKCQSSLREFYQQKISHFLLPFQAKDRFCVFFFAQGTQKALALQEKQSSISLPLWEISGSESRLDQSLQAWQSLFYEDAIEWDVVLFTDGNLSSLVEKDSMSILQNKARSIQIFSALPENYSLFMDVCIESIVLPSFVYQNTYTSGYLAFKSSAPGVFQVCIDIQGKRVYESFVQIDKAASSRVYFSIPIVEDAFASAKASIKPLTFEDAYPGNNSIEKEMRILGEPYLCVIGKEDNTIFPYPFFTIAPEDLSRTQAWKKASTVVLEKGHASHIGEGMESLREYVFSGGSLLVLGHETTLGQGRYSGTPLEKALPVLSASQNQNPIAFMIMLDASGSMEESIEGKSKLQEAKDAICSILGLLSHQDLVALFAFRDKAEKIFPLQTYSAHKEAFLTSLAKLHARGGTNIAMVFQAALDEISRLVENQKVYTILISDGMDAGDPKELLRLAKAFSSKNAMLSIISTAKENTQLLESLAKEGKGRFYAYPQKSFADSLLEEMNAIQKDFVKTGEIHLQALSPDSLTFPMGYLQQYTLQKIARVTPKAWGKVLLQTPEKEPVLIYGYYGLGRSAVFSGNFSPLWKGNLSQEAQKRLLLDILSWLTPPAQQEVEWELDFQEQSLEVQCTSSKIENPLVLQASWDAGLYPLYPQSPNQYIAIIPAPPQGKHTLQLQDSKTQATLHQHSLIIPYKPEYKSFGLKKLIPPPLLKTEPEAPKDLVPYILIIALAAFILERRC